jgi:hypothetical protein
MRRTETYSRQAPKGAKKKNIFFVSELGGLCVFARNIPSLGCGLPSALCLTVLFSTF